MDLSKLDPSAPFPARIAQLVEMAKTASPAQLRKATNDSIDFYLSLLKGATDSAVTFVPRDEGAHDPHAPADRQNDSWTLGHIIVHVTASSEEGAAVAAELARGVEYHGRSRYETDWESVKTVAQCRQRLEESRRMRLAALDMWPDAPNLSNTFTLAEGMPPMNATARFLLGLAHEVGHQPQAAAAAKSS
jgi:hypothetical protein